MRTTLTLDDDVAAALRRIQDTRGLTFKEAVNAALRRGLAELDAPRPRPDYRTPSVPLGRCLAGSIDDVSEALAVAEGDAYR
ncbi:MAG TPA: antitoxin [Chloroflexota bacterium]|nr:antitoxin [Chloroflexota bacterium]